MNNGLGQSCLDLKLEAKAKAMELNLQDLGLAVAEPLRYDIARKLSEAEARLPGGSPAGQVRKLRERHHTLARLLAAGTAPGDASRITGYCPSRVSVLQADPSFQELLAFYQGRLTIEALDMKAKLGVLAADVVSELQDRIEDEPESFKNTELTELLKAACDRVGFGPSSTVKNLNLNANATLDELKARILAEQKGHVETEDYEPAQRLTVVGAASLRSQGQPTTGSESPWADVSTQS